MLLVRGLGTAVPSKGSASADCLCSASLGAGLRHLFRLIKKIFFKKNCPFRKIGLRNTLLSFGRKVITCSVCFVAILCPMLTYSFFN